MRFPYFLFFASSLFFTSCRKDEVQINSYPQNYLFLGHTYQSPDSIDNRVRKLNFTYFDQIWLGGDILGETSSEWEYLEGLDTLVNLSSPDVHWAIGNHDIYDGNSDWISQFTQRPTYYATSFYDITLMVLNTTFFYTGYDSTEVNGQYEMIQNVCDTISESSHLIVMSHHACWSQIDDANNVGDYANTNFYGNFFHVYPTKYYEDGVYPLLESVQERGIQVINLAGDFGQKSTHYEYTAESGIKFIGSGITSEIQWNTQFPTYEMTDLILIFHHYPSKRELTWEFRPLE